MPGWAWVAAAALVVPAACFSAEDAAPPEDGLGMVRLMLSGRELSATQVEVLEADIAADPGAIDKRAMLLGYYDRVRSRRDPAMQKARYRHVLWVIRHRPESDLAGVPDMQICRPWDDAQARRRAEELWLDHVEKRPRDMALLRNAASFFMGCDPAKAEALFIRGAELEPGNGDWPRRLAQLYLMGSCTGDSGARYIAGSRAFAALARADRLAPTDAHRKTLLEDQARAAYLSKQYMKAREYCQKLIRGTAKCEWNCGSIRNLAHTILGLISLELKDMKEARAHLEASGMVDTTPQLSSLGPNMALAAALLEEGERRAVLDYLNLCERLWTMGGGKIKAWRAAVERGETPDFGANACIR